MGRFTGIEKTEQRKGGDYLGAGKYELEVIACKGDNNRDGRPYFACEVKVITAEPGSSHLAGREATIMFMLDRFVVIAMRDVRSIVSAAMGIPFASVDEKGMDKVCSEANPLRGRRFFCDAKDKLNKAKTSSYTVYTFTAKGAEAKAA